MEEFYKVLIKDNGEIIHDIFATSHKDLMQKYISPDEPKKSFFRATYAPAKDYKLSDVDNYRLTIDENYIPEWFHGALAEDVKNKLNEIISSMVVKGRKQLLLHEGAILCGNAVVDTAKHSMIFGMYDNARIKLVDNSSEVCEMTDDAIIDEVYDNVKIVNVWGFAKIKEMYNYSKIINMYGQAKVGKMFDHARIGVLKGDANILEMHNMSQADRLKHMSKVDEMHGHSVIEEMWDWTVVEKMFDQSRINFMDEEARVLEMHNDSIIEEMHGNAVVEKLYENSLVRKLHDKAQILMKELNK